jgi:hypothetical protein
MSLRTIDSPPRAPATCKKSPRPLPESLQQEWPDTLIALVCWTAFDASGSHPVQAVFPINRIGDTNVWDGAGYLTEDRPFCELEIFPDTGQTTIAAGVYRHDVVMDSYTWFGHRPRSLTPLDTGPLSAKLSLPDRTVTAQVLI